MTELSGVKEEQTTVKGFTDEEVIMKAINLPGPFVEMQTMKQKCSKKQRGLLLSETFERCIDRMVLMGMGVRHEATKSRKNGHPLLL